MLKNTIEIQSLIISQLLKSLSLDERRPPEKIVEKMQNVHEHIKTKILNLEIKETTIKHAAITADILEDSGFEDGQNSSDESINFDDVELTSDNAQFSRNDFDFSRNVSNVRIVFNFYISMTYTFLNFSDSLGEIWNPEISPKSKRSH